MSKGLRYGLIFLCFVGLALVRFRESVLFYDPFLAFFKLDYRELPLPEFNQVRYYLNVILRYSMNTIISICVIWLAFKDRSIVTFSTLLYCIAFFILLGLLWMVLQPVSSPNYLAIFYLRRFLMQPLFLFILLPAFYYQRKVKR